MVCQVCLKILSPSIKIGPSIEFKSINYAEMSGSNSLLGEIVFCLRRNDSLMIVVWLMVLKIALTINYCYE